MPSGKVKLSPLQTEIVSEIKYVEPTVIVMLLDVAGFPVAHASLDVSSQVTTSPLVRAVLVKVGLFVPAFVPFTFH